MTNAKDYVKVREQNIAVPTLDELKALIEAVIDDGEDVFINVGYLPLNSIITEKISKYQQEYGLLSFQFGIKKWLKEYN